MDLKEQLRKPTADQEAYFYVNSDHLESNLAFIKKHVIENLMLIPNEQGYRLKDIDFLKEVPFVKKIQMGACKKIDDYTGLDHLTNLIHLAFSAEKNIKVDLSNHTGLQELYFKFTPDITGFENLKNIETLSVDSGNEDFFKIELFSNFKNLKRLFIMLSKLKDLKFLKENTSIEYLEFNYMKSAFDLQGIQYQKNSLKKLKLISSKKINNINLISELKNLEWLILSNSVTLESTDVVEGLKKLEALTLYGSSYFIDGDLRALKSLKEKIKYYNVEKKKHYFYE